MTGHAAPPAGALSAPSRTELHRSGPWLVPVGLGAASDRVALEVARQCRAAGVDPWVVPIDEIDHRLNLAYFTALILVMQTTLPAIRATYAVTPFYALSEA